MSMPTLIGPMLDEVLDNLTIVELEQHLDDDVPCNWPACTDGAHWAFRCPGCPHEWLYCGPHRIEDERVDREQLADNVVNKCAKCWTKLPMPFPWRPL